MRCLGLALGCPPATPALAVLVVVEDKVLQQQERAISSALLHCLPSVYARRQRAPAPCRPCGLPARTSCCGCASARGTCAAGRAVDAARQLPAGTLACPRPPLCGRRRAPATPRARDHGRPKKCATHPTHPSMEPNIRLPMTAAAMASGPVISFSSLRAADSAAGSPSSARAGRQHRKPPLQPCIAPSRVRVSRSRLHHSLVLLCFELVFELTERGGVAGRAGAAVCHGAGGGAGSTAGASCRDVWWIVCQEVTRQ